MLLNTVRDVYCIEEQMPPDFMQISNWGHVTWRPCNVCLYHVCHVCHVTVAGLLLVRSPRSWVELSFVLLLFFIHFIYFLLQLWLRIKSKLNRCRRRQFTLGHINIKWSMARAMTWNIANRVVFCFCFVFKCGLDVICLFSSDMRDIYYK